MYYSAKWATRAATVDCAVMKTVGSGKPLNVSRSWLKTYGSWCGV